MAELYDTPDDFDIGTTRGVKGHDLQRCGARPAREQHLAFNAGGDNHAV
jgi:hypothetical protein